MQQTRVAWRKIFFGSNAHKKMSNFAICGKNECIIHIHTYIILHMHITLSHTHRSTGIVYIFFVIYLLFASFSLSFVRYWQFLFYPYFHISLYSRVFSSFMYSIFNLFWYIWQIWKRVRVLMIRLCCQKPATSACCQNGRLDREIVEREKEILVEW